MLEYLHHGYRGADPDEEKTVHHELRIEYPVLGMMPMHQRLGSTLEPPVRSRFRDKPDKTKFNLLLSRTNFIVRLSLRYVPFASLSALDLPPVFKALMSIRNSPRPEHAVDGYLQTVRNVVTGIASGLSLLPEAVISVCGCRMSSIPPNGTRRWVYAATNFLCR